MLYLTRLLERNYLSSHSTRLKLLAVSQIRFQSFTPNKDVANFEDEFRVLNLRAVRSDVRKRKPRRKVEVIPPRTHKMAVDQDWMAVWPGPRTFHPAAVPLPIRQGFTEKSEPAPSKFANAELMKIPNFLHLTPPAIKRQCEALKKFCTPWPTGIETEPKMKLHFPIEVTTSDYCHSAPTIRQPEARKVTLKIKLSDLKFDQHAKDKFLRLVGERHDPATDIVTFVGDRCPLKKQNYDYVLYLLTACYHESFITEPWEANKTEADMEYYDFNRNKSKISSTAILNWNSGSEKLEPPQSYAKSVEQLINEGENECNINRYKAEVLKMFNITYDSDK